MTTSLQKIEEAYVVDTHSLIWRLTNNQKLGSVAKDVFDAAQRGETQLIVSSIVMAEMYFVNKKFNVFSSFGRTYQELIKDPAYQFVSFTVGEVLDFDKNNKVSEMHDRMIVGLAIRLSVPLITHDRNITASGLVNVIWD